MICALCEQPKVLRKSHIVPEFLYAPLYDNLHRFVRVREAAGVKRDLAQKGFREELLCDDCEQFLNDAYERPFKKFWIDRNPLPARISPEGVILRNIDYESFKLFHLSVLFRAGVSRHPMFETVRLGPHQDTLRRMVKDKNAGKPENYPVFAIAVVNQSRAPVFGLMPKPYCTRFEGHTVYAFIFGGCMWFYTVSSHRSPNMIKIALQSNGQLWLVPQFWGEIASVQQLSRALRAYAP